jgi:hypothetical protein
MACNQPPGAHPAPATSASATAQLTTTAPLEGTYRIDAMLGLNPKTIAELGGARITTEEMLRKSVSADAYVYGRWLVTFSGNKLATRNEMILKLGSGYQWTSCEAEGTALWKGNELSLPGGLATKGRSGFVDHKDSHSGDCNVNLAAGTLTLKRDGGETRLYGSHDGSEFAVVLVKDDTDADVETRAHALAGNPKK